MIRNEKCVSTSELKVLHVLHLDADSAKLGEHAGEDGALVRDLFHQAERLNYSFAISINSTEAFRIHRL